MSTNNLALNINDAVYEQINKIRVENSLAVLTAVESNEDFAYVFRKQLPFSFEFDIENEAALLANISEQITSSFNTESYSNSSATHLDITVAIEENKVEVNVITFFNYAVLAEVGPVIDGDMVVQGTTLDSLHGPSLCILEYAESSDSPFEELLSVAPWNMLIDKRGQDVSFIIPISVPKQFLRGVVRARVYVDKEVDKIPYDNENLDFSLSPDFPGRICASEVVSEFGGHPTSKLSSRQAKEDSHSLDSHPPSHRDHHPSEEEAHKNEVVSQDLDEAAELAYQSHVSRERTSSQLSGGIYQIIRDVRVAVDFDEVASLQSEGYELICRSISAKGPQDDMEHLWKFHVLVSYGDSTEPGLDDIAWVKCLKSLGKVPVLAGYKMHLDHDLSNIDDDYSVYLGVKMAAGSKFKQLIMVSSAADDETHLLNYAESVRGVYRGAPAEVARSVGGPCGVILCLDTAEEMANRSPTMSRAHARETFDEHSDSDDDSADLYESDEIAMERLSQEFEDLQRQKETLLFNNADLQKKVAILLSREKTIQGQSSTAKAIPDAVGAAAASGNPNLTAAEASDKNLDHNQEREKQYQDTLLLILEEKSKLSKQNAEFDQLALDLQTRLDDKEFKANGIHTSFQQFKKEILQKCENSRTGHKIPRSQIQQIEALEGKREEDLEKIRLKNISLRTTYRKLEKALRSREQLAEGLHMIDFEQLKIENQTLIEKIEERSEELAKLKRKKMLTVQILTHIREKLRFVEQANSVVQAQLSSNEDELTKLRNQVTLEKLSRDAIKLENKDLKAKQGFATSDLLLMDYENRTQKVETLRTTLNELKERYTILLQQTNKVNGISTKSTNSVPSWLFSESQPIIN